MSLVIVLLGGIAMTRLPNRELPDVDPPIVSVTTVFTGAAPEVVETSVTQPLEDQLIGIEGIRHVTSMSSRAGLAITIEFELGRDVDAAANDVRDRVARAREHLPEEIEEPVVAKQDADAWPDHLDRALRAATTTRSSSRRSPRRASRTGSASCRASPT